MLKYFAQFYFDHDNKAAKYFKLTLKQVFASLGFIFGSLNDVINIVSTLLSLMLSLHVLSQMARSMKTVTTCKKVTVTLTSSTIISQMNTD